MTQPAPYAVVLAAGAGSRFGGAKLMASLNGRPLVAHLAANLAEVLAGGLVAGGVAIVPEDDSTLAWYFDSAGLEPIGNRDAASGIASSLRLGLETLERRRPAPGAALIVLADQPLLRPSVIARLVEVWRRTGRSVRPRYADRPDEPGHPVLLDRSLWPLAASLRGDQGLGPLLAADPAAITVIEVPGTNPDVDTPGDLQQLEDPRG